LGYSGSREEPFEVDRRSVGVPFLKAGCTAF